ncbi:MAG: DinB family protein [Terracidiphilus sp.]
MDTQKELIAEYDREIARTRKILEAIPADADFTFKPHPKSMALGRLAGHVSEMAGDWAIHTLTTDKLEFPEGHKFEPYIPASKEALLDRFDKETAKAKAALAGFAPAKWDENWKFVAGGKAWIDESKYEVWRTWVLNHLIHHRAQLGVYLRLLDKPIPGTYGPSADEM